MKHKKRIRPMALALAMSMVLSNQAFAAELPDMTRVITVLQETPADFELRTGYQLASGWHYVLDGECVQVYEDETPVIEADEVEDETPVDNQTPASDETTVEEPAPADGDTTEDKQPHTGKDESSEDTQTPENGDMEEDTQKPADENTETKNQTSTESEASGTPSDSENEPTDDSEEQESAEASYLTSEQFSNIAERIQYNVTVPIEGLPSFITQEMVVGALKAQDESGFPASVTIAQIIQESGFGSYGPGGEDGKGLSYLAYQYCNLFGIKGTGSAGSVSMSTGEMTGTGASYTINAGFRAYHTYTECIMDRTELLQKVYSDLTEGTSDANTFAVQIGKRWATDISYGQHLIQQMEKYDLYRLDDLTLMDFNSMIGRFANPCPGATISSTFGYRDFDHSVHKGLDLGTGSENLPTYAAEAGTVVTAGWSDSAGNWIVIDHGNGLVTKYMHHAEIYVQTGDHVEKGQQIGLSGTTGNSSGNHLHFQVEEDGTAVDPMPYLYAETTTLAMSQTAKEASAAWSKSKSLSNGTKKLTTQTVQTPRLLAELREVQHEKKSVKSLVGGAGIFESGTGQYWNCIANTANRSVLYADSLLLCKKF
ncbi:peptidoglycan DD-metalloendopeptidase family protein [Hespellia stercorisuis]|uniref:Mannosyl-glycoprotein endo-beta-N-acetylglucosaminidase n=1 Tax=Hespellia stercorisuis DSM 15480 TaxID=1121950 RepID=A0A1M6IA96_9FIRM|nr:peptidoglycan DD-metalloendopeptidase family protein [Hespellia stercorisuis]SHJ31327.1 Mannosyl-glycoprotein endo-beta-N-acetylglucosaminidase [Hespellia stercorisuis DSM 15480]